MNQQQPPATGCNLNQLQAMAISHFNKYPVFKDKEAAKLKYFTCWVNDMAVMIEAAGGTQQQFISNLVA